MGGWPNGLQLFHELVCVGLGFPPCCKGIERCVSHLHVLGNAPAIAATLPGVLCDIDCEDMGFFHTRIMRRRRQRRQSEIAARFLISDRRQSSHRYIRRPRTRSSTSASRVRREKAALSSGCEPHPATAPAGSNRSSYGGDEIAEAFVAPG